MVKRILIFLLCGISFQFGWTQNFSLFPVDRAITYENTKSEFLFVEIQNFEIVDGDSIFYFKQRIDTADTGIPECNYHTDDTCQIGLKYIKLDDGRELLFNKYNDTIFFEPNDTINQEWKLYTYENGDFIKARVLSVSYDEPFEDTPDSIKRLYLNVFDASNAHLEDNRWWGEKLDITFEHGLSRFFDINEFPFGIDTIINRLSGATNPEEGNTDLTSYDAFNFQPGYEFHYREEQVPDDGSDADIRISAWKYFVMNRIESPTSVTFTMERIKFDTLYFGATATSSLTWDTIDVTINYADYAFLDTLEMNLFEFTNFGYSDWQQNDTIFTGIAHKYVYDWYNYDDATHCLSNPDNIDQPEQLYGDGLGLMHYQDSTDADNYYKFDMVYFQVGLLEWGVPYDFSDLDLAISDIQHLNKFLVFPNPAADLISVQFLPSNQTAYYEIYSLDGKTIAHSTITENNNQIDISRLPAGLYSISIYTDEQVESHQFIKMND